MTASSATLSRCASLPSQLLQVRQRPTCAEAIHFAKLLFGQGLDLALHTPNEALLFPQGPPIKAINWGEQSHTLSVRGGLEGCELALELLARGIVGDLVDEAHRAGLLETGQLVLAVLPE